MLDIGILDIGILGYYISAFMLVNILINLALILGKSERRKVRKSGSGKTSLLALGSARLIKLYPDNDDQE